MITAYRIFNAAYTATWADGDGAFRYGGRWNSPGVRLLYAAVSVALAALEVLVHLDDEEILADYSFASMRFPADSIINVADIADLPRNWQDPSALGSLQEIGDSWVRCQTSLALRVPSAVVPQEFNYMINLEHPSASRIKFGKVEQFVFDPRFVKGRTGKK